MKYVSYEIAAEIVALILTPMKHRKSLVEANERFTDFDKSKLVDLKK